MHVGVWVNWHSSRPILKLNPIGTGLDAGTPAVTVSPQSGVSTVTGCRRSIFSLLHWDMGLIAWGTHARTHAHASSTAIQYVRVSPDTRTCLPPDWSEQTRRTPSYLTTPHTHGWLCCFTKWGLPSNGRRKDSRGAHLHPIHIHIVHLLLRW